MSGFNRVILMGNLTADPELRYTPQGTAVTDLRLAVNTGRKDKEEVLFIDCTVWDKQAESACEFLSKGRPVLVEGRLTMQEWTDKDSGAKRSKTTVTAQAVQFLGGAPEERGSKPRQHRQENRRNSDPPEDLDRDFDGGNVLF